MSAQAFNYINDLISQTCIDCGCVFALPRDLDSRLRENHRSFFCPNGHPQQYVGETEAQKLKKELDRERQRREMAELCLVRGLARATKAENELGRVKKRVQNGVCPCCNRTFQNLARHMATKHPEHPAR